MSGTDPDRALSVVLVEDNEDIRDSMQELLTALGHVVHAASDGTSGAELILQVEPDVAIVDIGLPGIDGYEVAARVRHRLGHERLRMVAMTGYGDASDRRRTREAGFDAHLLKPAGIDDVVKVMLPPAAQAAPGS
jgi:two-component system, sensor histidine kinase